MPRITLFAFIGAQETSHPAGTGWLAVGLAFTGGYVFFPAGVAGFCDLAPK